MIEFLYISVGHIVYIVIPPLPTPQDIVELEEKLKRAKQVINSI